MTKISLILLLAVVFVATLFAAADVEVNLDGTTAGHAFTVKNNNATPDTLLKVGGAGNVRVKTGSYLNYGSTVSSEGSAGYGFRDNGGILEYKNSSGSWTPWTTAPTTPYGFGSGTYSYGQIAYNHGNYGTTQPTVEIGADSAYETMLPAICATGSTPWETIANGDVSIAEISGKPAYLKINAAGTYRICATVAIQGTSNTSIEVEIFRQNSGSIPATNSWITNTHDLESLSTALSVTNNQYDSGSVSGIMTCAANDYIALCSRVVSGSSSTQKVINLNLNVERIR